MANHRYTSLRELLDAPQRRTPSASNDLGNNSEDYPFPFEMFGELCLRERSIPRPPGSSIWDLFTPPLPPPRPLPNPNPLHDHAEVEGLDGNPDPNQVQGLNEGDDADQVPGLNQNEQNVGVNEDENSQIQVQGLNEGSLNPQLANENEIDEGRVDA